MLTGVDSKYIVQGSWEATQTKTGTNMLITGRILSDCACADCVAVPIPIAIAPIVAMAIRRICKQKQLQ
jgi:hypothetical protein